MKWLLVLLFFFVKSQEADVPADCYRVEHDTYEECYTFSNTTYSFQTPAESTCASSGGRLAIIKDELTWKLLIEKFLKGFSKEVWLGYKVDSSYAKLIPVTDLSNMTNFWSSNSLSSSYRGYCLYAVQNTWKWQLTQCHNYNYAYFCQYNISCNLNDLHVKIKHCISANFIRHNDTIEIKCEFGYFVNTNNNELRCIAGNWQQVQCIPGCPPPGKRRNAILTSVKDSYDIGETVYYICENNYFNDKNHKLPYFSTSCQPDSTWSDEDSECGSKHQFSVTKIEVKIAKGRISVSYSPNIVTIDGTSIIANSIELVCGLNSTGILWLWNGKHINNAFPLFNVKPNSNLVVQVQKDKDFEGFYTCVGKVDNQLLVGKEAYEVIKLTECRSSEKKKTEAKEGENLLLGCPQDDKYHDTKWFKDEEEIFSNEHQNVLPRTGLLLSNVKLQDEGTYKCQTTYKENNISCEYNITHEVSVVALAESICGTKSITTKIYQPWLAILHQDDEIIPFCYGTLIANKWIVTSAYCLIPLRRKKVLQGFTVQFGSADKNQTFPIAAVVIHPLYRARRNLYDIGLVKLMNSPVKFSGAYLPACISPEDIGVRLF